MRDKGSRYKRFIYKSERLSWKVGQATPQTTFTVQESGRRKWRVAEGDALLFTQGSGMALRFLAVASVLRVDSKIIRDGETETTIVTATVGSPFILPDGLLLSRFMFSLIAVANFSHPWLHLRHKTHLALVDVDTLREARIAWDRTVYFGLLRKLPSRWRQVLEAESRVRWIVNNPGALLQSWTAPVRELLELLEATLMSPLRLAAKVHTTGLEVLGAEAVASFDLGDAEGRVESWNLPAFLRFSAGKREPLESQWEGVRELPLTESLEGMEFRWRPHRW